MRLWSVHPQYLDAKGLVALWRETLLAQAVLAGKTKGYRHHPQLQRFQNQENPLEAIGSYLVFIHEEAQKRGYSFDVKRILKRKKILPKIKVTKGQLEYEREHLLNKLKTRDPARYKELKAAIFSPHPLFSVVKGGVADWEVVKV